MLNALFTIIILYGVNTKTYEDAKKHNEFSLISDLNVKSIRPGYGMLPKYIGSVIGKRASRDIN